MSIIFIERAFTNSPHLFIETVWPCYTVKYWKKRVGGINWKLYPQNNVKILGVVLNPSTILEEMFVNWESKMDSIEKVVRFWTKRNLSVVGKIQIVKSLLASKFSYIGSIVDLQQVFMNRINSVFFKFVWGGSEKVKRSTLINDYDEGGLKMLNFQLFLDSLKISWLKKLISPGKDTWKIIPLYILNKTHLGINILECNCTLDNMNKFVSVE